MPLSQVEDLVDTRLAPKISQLSGVGLVSISGGQKPAVRIQANPTALSSYGINLEDLRTALTQASVNQPRATSTGRGRTTRSTPTISSSPARLQEGRRRLPQRRAGDADRRGEVVTASRTTIRPRG
jgi:multidrug efflux pump subunit AcrB